MRSVSGDSSSAAPPKSVSLLDSLSPFDMSLLQSLGPVQSWLGQELEKCGIDAMIYTRYVLSLLLHDSYDYDLQDQENDIFLGWEKGAGKKWGKSRRKGGTDLSLEEMKKQAAVQCLRSASDENSGVESLVEELCSKLKDIQNKQKVHSFTEKEKQTIKRSDESRSPELAESPSSKDQVEMYYEAFPPLSEKPVCLQEIMTVWNKAKASAYSSSSSAAPQTSTDTSSPKDCTSEGEVIKDKATDASVVVSTTTIEKAQQRRSKKEKENRYHGGASGACNDQVVFQNKRHAKHRSDLGHRPRSWSSGSSEGGSSSSGNQGEAKTCKGVRIRQRSREISSRNKRGRNYKQVKLALKAIDKEERRNTGSSCSASEGPLKHQQHYTKKGKKPLRELRKDTSWVDLKESGGEANNREYMEEPLWYTEPISEYFVPFSWSKLETKYRSKPDSPTDLATAINVDSLSEQIQGICIANTSIQRAYLAAGTFVDGHFVEVSSEANGEATELNGTSSCPLPEDGKDLDDEHLSEFTHFYEVDIYQSILDPSASDAVQESRILNMIRQKSNEPRDIEAGCCVDLDGFELQGESAIKADSLGASGDDVILTQDMENIAHMWECCSSSTSEELEGESCAGDSPVRLSPMLGSVPFNLSGLSGTYGEPSVQDVTGSTMALNSCFSLFEVQCDSSAFPFSCDSLASSRENIDSSSFLDSHANKQSRLLIWTKNSAFDENEHCSNLSTRTCSPWSHSEETRSDIEQVTGQADESSQFGSEELGCIIPPVPTSYLEEEFLDFLQESPSHQQDKMSAGIVSNQTFNKVSKLESVCGIALEQDEGKQYNSVLFPEDTNQQNDDYSSGIIKDIWMAIGDRDCVLALELEKADDDLFSEETSSYHCGCLDGEAKETIEKKAVQRSEYHLWKGKKEDQGLAKNQVSKVDGGDYATPARPWDVDSERDSTSFILGGVYGELKSVSSDEEWTVVQPINTCENLLQCASASSSDVVTIAGTDVFMNTGSCFAPGHKPLWRPLVSFGQNSQATKGSGEGLNKGFSVIFHEDLLGSCGGYCGEQQGLDYPFSSFDLNNPFSQVLHVECSFEPEDMASFSPGFKPKSILCSNSDNEPFSPSLYGINRTQYRAIRISPRTHFRPISASELSPGCCSVSDGESEKEEMSLPITGQSGLFDNPQADLKPLEEDAESEGPYYGKSELESGKFLPRLKKSGMEKSAQTSLDSQEGGGTTLTTDEQEICLDCEVTGKSSAAVSAVSSLVELPVDAFQKPESCIEREACRSVGASQLLEFGKSYNVVQDLNEFPLLSFGERSVMNSQREDCWWQNTLCSSIFSGSRCTESSNI
ncbi:uncharacterized protein KIAA0232 homolog isoform X1 [Tachysurus vachellii]|uniref:uncharacterized protein KIAA0232 homolog isoform X1 n=1 Tax=Tachysurus vachellii TaxID=175792 RepID=UPI00296AE049|nr:uncharacterized protein KIAA0232 homolog isoform X1 [Tachysurus vachellii]